MRSVDGGAVQRIGAGIECLQHGDGEDVEPVDAAAVQQLSQVSGQTLNLGELGHPVSRKLCGHAKAEGAFHALPLPLRSGLGIDFDHHQCAAAGHVQHLDPDALA